MPSAQRSLNELPHPKTAVLAALLLFATSCTSGAAPAAPAAMMAPAAAETVPSSPAATAAAPPVRAISPSEVSGANAHRHVVALAADIGPRVAGAQGERDGAAYVGNKLRSFGYDVTQQAFTFTTFEDLSSVRVIGDPSEVEVSLISRSVEGSARGMLADGGIGTDLAPGSMTGKIALLERGQLTFEDKAARASAAGATAAIIFNNQPGLFRGSMQSASAIPAIAISREDGLRLRQALAARPVEVEAKAESVRRTENSQNVVGRNASACELVIGGHYDSVPAGPGANDNASGTAVMLEVARVLAPNAAAWELCFVAFGAEEVGLYGSRAFVEQLDAAARKSVRAMINLDMVGVGDAWKLYGSAELSDPAREAAQEAGIQVESGRMPRGQGSDHASFIDAGIPAVFLHLTDDPNYHTPQDVAGQIAPAHLEAAGRATVALVPKLLGGR